MRVLKTPPEAHYSSDELGSLKYHALRTFNKPLIWVQDCLAVAGGPAACWKQMTTWCLLQADLPASNSMWQVSRQKSVTQQA